MVVFYFSHLPTLVFSDNLSSTGCRVVFRLVPFCARPEAPAGICCDDPSGGPTRRQVVPPLPECRPGPLGSRTEARVTTLDVDDTPVNIVIVLVDSKGHVEKGNIREKVGCTPK